MTEYTQTREAYGQALLELGSRRQDVVVLDADLYKSTRTVLFRDAFPERFLDIGISEADMVSTAAGMASTGLIPYANSFAMFITGVCYMPIRTQIAYPSLSYPPQLRQIKFLQVTPPIPTPADNPLR